MAEIAFVPLHKTKTLFGQSSKVSFLTQRQQDLDAYVKRLAQVTEMTRFCTTTTSLQYDTFSKVLADFVLLQAHLILIETAKQKQHSQREDAYEKIVESSSLSDTLGERHDKDYNRDDTMVHKLSTAQQEELQQLIFQRISDQYPRSVLKTFQKKARQFGRMAIPSATTAATSTTHEHHHHDHHHLEAEADAFYAYLLSTFGTVFCEWLVPSVSALIPAKEKRQALARAVKNAHKYNNAEEEAEEDESQIFQDHLDHTRHGKTKAMMMMMRHTCPTPQAHNTTTSMNMRRRPASETTTMVQPPVQSTPQRLRPASCHDVQSRSTSGFTATCMSGRDVLAQVRQLVSNDEHRMALFKQKTKELRHQRLSAINYSRFIIDMCGDRIDVAIVVLSSVASALKKTHPVVEDALQVVIQTVNGDNENCVNTATSSSSSSSSSSTTTTTTKTTSTLYYEKCHDNHKNDNKNNNSETITDNDTDDVKDPILHRLRNQGAVNLMCFR